MNHTGFMAPCTLVVQGESRSRNKYVRLNQVVTPMIFIKNMESLIAKSIAKIFIAILVVFVIFPSQKSKLYSLKNDF